MIGRTTAQFLHRQAPRKRGFFMPGVLARSGRAPKGAAISALAEGSGEPQARSRSPDGKTLDNAPPVGVKPAAAPLEA